MADETPLERLKKAGFTSSPISFERVQRLQEELDLHVDELGKLMGSEWVVLTAYLLGEAASSRGLAADLLGELAQELNAPNLKAPGARAMVVTSSVVAGPFVLPMDKPEPKPKIAAREPIVAKPSAKPRAKKKRVAARSEKPRKTYGRARPSWARGEK